jgi:hypothetical protein
MLRLRINLLGRGGKGMYKMTPARKVALKKAQDAAAMAKRAGGMHDKINTGIKRHGPIPFATANRINYIAEARYSRTGTQIRFTRSKKFYNTTSAQIDTINRMLSKKGL